MQLPACLRRSVRKWKRLPLLAPAAAECSHVAACARCCGDATGRCCGNVTGARLQVSDASVFPYSAVGQLLGQIGNTNTCAPAATQAQGAAPRQSRSRLPATGGAMCT